MRKFLYGAAVLAVAAPGVAAAEGSGVVGAGYANVDTGSSNNTDVYDLSGAYSYAFANGWTVQTDAATSRIDSGGSNIAESYGAIHLGLRNDSHALAGFFGMTDALYSGLDGGLEGQVYVGQLTFDGSVAYADFDTPDVKLTNVHLGGAYFLTDDLSLGAEVGYTESDGAGDSHWTTAGVSGAYRFSGTPVSLTLGYQNRSGDIDADVWKIGFNLDLGSGSLRARSQSGASWNGASSLNDEVRYAY
ncbi:MAG: hypothetical protein ABUL42_02600 [Terricaulis silvestris]